MEENKFFKKHKNNYGSKIINWIILILLLSLVIIFRNILIEFLKSTYEIFRNYLPYFQKGFAITIVLSLIAVFFGSIFGSLLYFFSKSKIRILSKVSNALVRILRGTPLLLQLSLAFFGIGTMIDFRELGMSVSTFSFIIGAISVSINSGAYVSEIIRSGIQSVDKGQIEAGKSLGMTKYMTTKEIVIPQAIRNIFPALINEFIAIIKETSIVSTFGVMDIMYNVNLVRGSSFKSLEPLLIAGIMYFVITFILSKIARKVERKMQND